MSSFVNWFEQHMLTCPYKALSGFDCPGCGMQRSFIELLKGDFVLSFQFYPALIFILATLTITGAHLYFKFKNGANIVKYSFIISTAIIFSNYVLKMCA